MSLSALDSFFYLSVTFIALPHAQHQVQTDPVATASPSPVQQQRQTPQIIYREDTDRLHDLQDEIDILQGRLMNMEEMTDRKDETISDMGKSVTDLIDYLVIPDRYII